MASEEDMIEHIKALQQQNDVRSQETQTLRTELNNVTVNYQAEIAKLKNDIIEMVKKNQREEQEHGYGSSKFKDKDAKEFKPDKWIGEKDKIGFREFYDSMLNWASVLHEDAVELMEQAEKGRYGVDENGVQVDDQKEVSARVHATLMAVTTGEPRKIVNSVHRGEGFKAWHELIKYYDPRSISDKLADHTKITHPSKRAKDYNEGMILLNGWLSDISNYEM